jgi:uncharacterized protein DUF6510
MDALDGNAIAGDLHAVFGCEMTVATCTCGACGASSYLAEIAVYLRAPGVVGRCRSCDNVLLVLTAIRGVTCVDGAGLADLVSP